MLGASIYLSESEEMNLKMIDILHMRGIKKLFTSLHIPEENPKQTLIGLKKILSKIQLNHMTLTVDVSAGTLEQYGLSKEEATAFFTDLGVTSLRMDYGFSHKEIKQLSDTFEIVLNASTITEETCQSLIETGLDLTNITVCHNYYPRENTGLDLAFFLRRNQFLKEKGFTIQAFIPGDLKKRGPIYAGLPTLEAHRGTDPLLAYLELKEHYLVDEVLIGDIMMTEDALDRIVKWEKEHLMVLPVQLLSKDLPENFYAIHRNRQDVARDVVRSEDSRVVLKTKEIQPRAVKDRPIGTVTLDNDLYRRYKGELQITKRALPADDKVNVLASVQEKSLGLLEYIIEGVKFQFMEGSE